MGSLGIKSQAILLHFSVSFSYSKYFSSANGQTKTDSCLHKEYQLFLLCSCFRLTYSVPVNSNTDKVTTNAHSQGKRFLAEKVRDHNLYVHALKNS